MSRVTRYVINDKDKMEQLVSEAKYQKMLSGGTEYDYDIETNLMEYKNSYSGYIYVMLLTIILLVVGIVIGNYYINKSTTTTTGGTVVTKVKGQGEQVKIEIKP